MNAPSGTESALHVGCPLCQTECPLLHRIDSHQYHRCPSCTHQFLHYTTPGTHVAEHYNDDYCSGAGDGYPDYLAQRDHLISRGTSYAKKLARLTGRTSGNLLDVGSAAGFLAKGFQAQGWNVQGIEPSAAMAAHASEREGIPTACGSLEQFETAESFDLILLVQVIAHLEDPAAALTKIKSLLNPGGYVIIETWDSDSHTARLLRSGWHEYNPPSVLHAFTRRSLQTLVEQHEFKTVTTRHTIKSVTGAHGKALLDYRYSGSRAYNSLLKPALRLMPDNLSVPYPADDLFWTCLQSP